MTSERQQIEAVLQVYFDGLYENDPAKIKQAFHECTHLFSADDGKLGDMSREVWIEKMRSRPSAKSTGQKRNDQIVSIDQTGPATALAKVHCQLPPRFFTDYLMLVKLADGWKIVSKTFHTEMR
jgi:Putative lumazine-binding